MYDDRLAAKPPMGWNSWNQVRCFDLTEQVVRDAADALVATGMRDAGYEYVVVDDCWQAHARGADGALRAHPERFPSGMKALADHVHRRGLKFGIYASPGSDTCAMFWDQYPGRELGSLGHERQDADLFASWGVDFLKYDWCRADITSGLDPKLAFTVMRDALRATGRDIVYSISEYGDYSPWTWARGIAHLWRTTQDLQPTWTSVATVIGSQALLADHTGRPGGWNDPDMLQVGNGTLTDIENRTHFSMWTMLNAPLFVGTDLTALSVQALATLTNHEVIAIGQDFAGSQGRRIHASSQQEVWTKPLSNGDQAVLLYNGAQARATVSVDLSGSTGSGWKARDLWAGRDLVVTHDRLSADLDPHAVALYRLTPRDPASPAGEPTL